MWNKRGEHSNKELYGGQSLLLSACMVSKLEVNLRRRRSTFVFIGSMAWDRFPLDKDRQLQIACFDTLYLCSETLF